MIEFTKMEGLGNDYIYVNTDRFPIPNPAEAAIRWSRPHTGIGSDGLILVSRSEVADFRMRIFNADGSEAMMCGNGSRCVGRFVYEHGLTDRTAITLETLSGIKHISGIDHPEAVTVDMGEPLLQNREQVSTPTGDLTGIELQVNGQSWRGTYVCMGNPHVVFFCDDLGEVKLEEIGPLIECHPLFPQRTNVEFVQVLSAGDTSVLRMRVWERGSGVTQACGTGACATATAAFITERANRHSIIRMDGGDLDITLRETDNHILMTGPATTVFQGRIESIRN